ncbi:5-formyltetrahydrofolate cyclo-ligase [Affinibrenneria salicis]|uniref:5-formyltetrahydrofolate cyclo-ligase n=1 Tax=Affinibrenneria salicis TaxID=2590031 RepID=A0A5J5G106_9GAMM|nr:5-formyltetrahydrofolate cyclo-ligase [Affinibrenneria salicis]KAA8999407.1 5-formyltetrahydrofolate cyclo-ligase [Affinibrenneria salicis]
MQPSSSGPPCAAQTRQLIRQTVRQRRRQLSAQQQAEFAAQLVARLDNHPRIRQAQRVALFLSFDGELDTAPLIRRFWQLQKQVYLPVLHPFSPGHLLFLRYEAHTPLVINRLKIAEPRLDVRHVLPVERLDVLFTPLVAFDEQGQRLGMGGGFYDRTLQHWRRRGPYPIGLAHDCQQVSPLPAAGWDVPLPEIVTPSRQWRFVA